MAAFKDVAAIAPQKQETPPGLVMVLGGACPLQGLEAQRFPEQSISMWGYSHESQVKAGNA